LINRRNDCVVAWPAVLPEEEKSEEKSLEGEEESHGAAVWRRYRGADAQGDEKPKLKELTDINKLFS
jgi:hypothetical protein